MDCWIRQKKSTINTALNLPEAERQNPDEFSIDAETKVLAYAKKYMRMSPEDYFSYHDGRKLKSLEARIDGRVQDGNSEDNVWYIEELGLADGGHYSDN